MLTIRPALALFCLAFPALTLAHDDQDHGHAHQAGIHQHGVGALNIVLDGAVLDIELSGPADNFLGFEHQPTNEEQRNQARRVLTALQQPGSLFILPVQARCVSDLTEIRSALLEDLQTEAPKHEHDHDHDHDHSHNTGSESHQDIAAHYRFRCSNPEALDSIELAVFSLFPNTERLLIQSVGMRGQSGGEATASQPVVRL